jgi:DNA topoisomerase-2
MSSSISKPSYVSLDQRTHVLHRPDMYIGSIKNIEINFYGAEYVRKEETKDEKDNDDNDDNDDNEDNKNMLEEEEIIVVKKRDKKKKKKKIVDDDVGDDSEKEIYISKKRGEINSGLHRIFIEVLSNAIDNVWRSSNTETKSTKIKVDIDDIGRITVWNDGLSIPVEINPDSGLYNPELIFGKLLTSSNYDDKEERMTSGKNGLGQKCTNIFSKEFSVKLFDSHTGHQFIQNWKNNMSEKDKPKITSPKQKTGYTQISFLPDYERFGVKELSKEMRSLMFRNVLDTAMITGINIYYNGNKIPLKSLKDYSLFYYLPKEREEVDMISINSSDSNIVVCPNLKGDSFCFTSFVNGIETFNGGIHVDTWCNSLLQPVLSKINSSIKKGGSILTMRDIKPYFHFFIKCQIPNPCFSSQEKSYLTSPNVNNPVEVIENKHINSILKWSIIDNIKNLVKGRELNALKKIEKKKGFVKIEGLDQANFAGTKNAHQCSLILCEGDSAKTFAVKGIQTGVSGKKGRDYFGVYPLRGKVLNVRNSNIASITKNKEIGDIIKALNLKYGVDYKDSDIYDSLSYGRIIILTDSDVDGYHICGLLLNFFHKLFPTLIDRNPSFITCMRTPIVRIYYGKSDLSFYTLEDFKRYQEENPNKKGDVKYFKGLGTNNNEEIKNSFGKKMIEFIKDDKTDYTMDKVFHSKFSDQRKIWLKEYNPSKEVEIVSKNPVQLLEISKFLDNEMIKFSIDDCKRSIPCVMDGLKESHRKILYATFLKNLKYNGKTMKVAQLAGFVAEKTNYHHGEQCLLGTITSLAQDFVGSNNIPLLFRDGQYGSRISGGKDAASARYIFTKLDVLTRLIFREEDDELLNYLYDDGDKVEPTYYVPIIPTILINGCSAGIGTGWSSHIPCYNPNDIIKSIRKWIKKEEEKEEDEIIPWYRDFNGTIEKIGKNKYITKGIYEKKMVKSVSKVIVTELPINIWIDKFKESLDDLLESKKIKGYKNNSSDIVINFEIDEHKESEFECNDNTLGLTSSISTNNMVLFNKDGEIKKYESVNDILNEFCHVRYEFYVKRKEHILTNLKHDLEILKNKMRFLKEVMDDTLVIKDVNEESLVKEMTKRDYYIYDKDKSYGYLLNMNIRSFTKQKLDTLQKEIDKIDSMLEITKKTTPNEMWLNELSEFEAEYNKIYKK